MPSVIRYRRPFATRLCALAALAVLGLAAVGLTACGPSDPQERVAELRGRYTAELNSFSVQEVPLEPEPLPGEEGEMEGEEAAAEEAAGGEGEGMEPVPVRKDALLDILIQNRANEPLPGLTLDVTLVDADKNEKARYRPYMDTSGLLKGRGESFIHRVEDVPYEPGDGFHVEVRHPIPAAERGEYREFSAAGGAG